jgi:hypothetical protein
LSEEVSFQECGTYSKRIGDDLDEETKTTHSRECKDYKSLIETNTLPKKKRGPVQTVGKSILRKRKKKNPKEGNLSSSPRWSLHPRHKNITYHLPNSDEDDMTDSKLSPKSTGFLCVSTDPCIDSIQAMCAVMVIR